MVSSILATPEPDDGRVRLEVSGGTPGEALYVFRRDSAGVGVVRDTSAATVVWPETGPPVATNLVVNGTLDTVNEDGSLWLLQAGTAARVTRDSEHPARGGAGWSARIRWGGSTYPSTTRFPSASTYPRES